MITSVITGDIIKSRDNTNPDAWIRALKEVLSNLANEKKYWDIYRGDSFQIEIRAYLLSFNYALYIKSYIKAVTGLNVRLAIGIGNKSYEGKTVTESNGEAFLFSGETLETLKKEKQNLRIKTNNFDLDQELNLYFKLALIAMDNWTVNTAEIVKLTLENPDLIQNELGKMIGINQNAVSTRQKRAHLTELLELDLMFREKVYHNYSK